MTTAVLAAIEVLLFTVKRKECRFRVLSLATHDQSGARRHPCGRLELW